MIQQETIDAIDKLFYGKYEEPKKLTSLICYQQEPELLNKLIQHMPTMLVSDNKRTFPIVIDSHTTASIMYCKEDFTDTIKPSPFHQMQRLAEHLDIMDM